MCLSSPNPYVEILMPSVVVLGSEAFERCLDHESGTFISGISVFVKETLERPCLFHHVRILNKRGKHNVKEILLLTQKICYLCSDKQVVM